ncbi:MAG: tyrosine-type recombinase/integrase [Saprospiraceae bacterium]|nr:tyrosine-type recombinase/integrase [Saprospiraceae bacterium]
MIRVSKKMHKDKWQIFLDFDDDLVAINKIKRISSAKYSYSNRAWYIDYDKLSWQAFLRTGLKYQIDDFGTTGDTQPISDHAEKKQADVPRVCMEKAADQSGTHLRYFHPFFFISGKLTGSHLDKIKTLPKAYWNHRYQNWVLRANLENLEFIYRDLELISQTQLDVWKKQISLISNPPKCILYQSPEFPEKILLQLSGDGVDIDFVKHIPERSYHAGRKFWVVPHEEQILKRILDHYTSQKTIIINKLYSGKAIQKTTSYLELRKHLLARSSSELKPFAETYLDALIRERYSGHTVKEYYGKFIQFSKAIQPKKCNEITVEEVNAYLAEISQKKVSDSLINTLINAIKFYYEKVVFLADFKIERIKRPRKALLLPKVLSVEEVDRLIRSTENLKHCTILFALYGHGLRLSELLNLRLEDVLWDRNQLFIKSGKGKKDRYVNLSQEFKGILSLYVHEYKPKYWLFEGQQAHRQYAERSVQEIVKKAASKACINKRVTPHTLRHCYATHLLDSGTQLPYIKELLGHKDIKTTMIYTHITTASIENVVSPLDVLIKYRTEISKKPQ